MDIELIRKICNQLQGVTEDIKWGNDLVFSVGNKMFCVAGLEATPSVSFKVNEESFDELCSRTGFRPAPYLARHHWVNVQEQAKISAAEWKVFIVQSYDMVKSKLPAKIRKQVEGNEL